MGDIHDRDLEADPFHPLGEVVRNRVLLEGRAWNTQKRLLKRKELRCVDVVLNRGQLVLPSSVLRRCPALLRADAWVGRKAVIHMIAFVDRPLGSVRS